VGLDDSLANHLPTLTSSTVPFESSNLIVPQESTSWPEGRKERISVNNFGVGGTNVHVSIFFLAEVDL
jgi:acyl transferase domain-containing protein